MKNFLLFLLALALLTAIVLRVRYGGGDPYRDLSEAPRISDSQLEEVLNYPEPIGNVAVNREGRIFFTVHPESRPQGNKLLEWVQGVAVPYPSATVIRSPRIRWADGLSFGPDGWLYLADSALPELVLRSRNHIDAQGPYYIFRFDPKYDAANE